MGLFKGFFKMNKCRLEIVFLLFFFSSFSFALDCSKIQFRITNNSLIYCVGQDVNLTTNLVNPAGPLTPELKCLQTANIFNSKPVIMPVPQAIPKNQRPFPIP